MGVYSHFIFLHGLVSSSQAYKAGLLRQAFPGMVVPDFTGSLDERMVQLDPILTQQESWVIFGSSFGGLMASIFTCIHPEKVQQLILFAPALIRPQFAGRECRIDVPTTIFHGIHDEVIPMDMVRPIAEQTFTNLDFRVVDDEHGLGKTASGLDWHSLLLPKQGGNDGI